MTIFLGDDPRLRLALPWAGTHILGGLTSTTSMGGAVVVALVLIVLPGGLVVQLLRQRRFGMKFLLALPAIVGLGLLILQRLLPDGLPTAGELVQWTSALGLGILQGSLLGLLIAWSLARRWRRVRRLLVLHLWLVVVA